MCLALMAASLLVSQMADGAGFHVVFVDTIDSPRRLAAAPLDDNHRVDLMVVETGSGGARLQVLLNHGTQFTPAWTTTYPVGSGNIFDVDLADTDNDLDYDVVFVRNFGTPGERFNDGHGNFDAVGFVPTASVRFENELREMNGDHCVDLVYYEPDFFFDSYFGTQVGWGDGTFHFSSEIKLIAEIEDHRRIALGDITGDGLVDGVFTSVISGGIRLFKGKLPPPLGQTPGWEQPQLVFEPPCDDAVVADLDGDGRLDIIASSYILDSVVVLRTQPGGAVGSPVLYAAGQGPDALAVANFDLDGRLDVVVANPATGTVHVMRGTGAGGLGAPREVPVGQSPLDVATADFDNDGDIDVAVACVDHVAVLFNHALSATVHVLPK